MGIKIIRIYRNIILCTKAMSRNFCPNCRNSFFISFPRNDAVICCEVLPHIVIPIIDISIGISQYEIDMVTIIVIWESRPPIGEMNSTKWILGAIGYIGVFDRLSDWWPNYRQDIIWSGYCSSNCFADWISISDFRKVPCQRKSSQNLNARLSRILNHYPAIRLTG